MVPETVSFEVGLLTPMPILPTDVMTKLLAGNFFAVVYFKRASIGMVEPHGVPCFTTNMKPHISICAIGILIVYL